LVSLSSWKQFVSVFLPPKDDRDLLVSLFLHCAEAVMRFFKKGWVFFTRSSDSRSQHNCAPNLSPGFRSYRDQAKRRE
jgi:hypothetical protein